MSVTTTHTVSGMTSSHCVRAVSEDLTRLPGVHGASIAAGSGAFTVESQFDRLIDEVRTAVDEAGYELADAGA